MHLLLTDRLACPRCGPQFGLILLARDLQERRVLRGDLGCANCRQHYAIQAGVADLRPAGHPPDSPDLAGFRTDGDEEGGTARVAALVGVTEGPAQVLLHGNVGQFAPSLAQIVPGVDWIVTHPGASDWEETEGVDRIRAQGTLPFYDRVLRAVVFENPGSFELAEVGRVIQPGGRVVWLDSTADGRTQLEALGFDIAFESGQVLVGARR